MLGTEGVGEICKTSFTDRTQSLAVGHLHALLFMVHGRGIVEAWGRHGFSISWWAA